MNLRKLLLLASFLSLCFVTAACAQSAPAAPKVTISPARVTYHGHVDVAGTGFTAKRNVSSHLRRPDGSEFPVLPILTNDRGEFSHDIDTLLFSFGTYELWVVDDSSKISSNLVKFDVTPDQPPTK